MPYYPVNTNKRTERKLTLGQLITMATRLMKASIITVLPSLVHCKSSCNMT